MQQLDTTLFAIRYEIKEERTHFTMGVSLLSGYNDCFGAKAATSRPNSAKSVVLPVISCMA